ncbi:Methyltransferase domain-containing protein [Chitinophaga sp. YR627]|uniref:class I SAM-dependent methyltransferase n=1 Tax=Chitinophaga sp. YR627 TaxID=1881041 RepID=UPI0008ED1528|nr:methyltransferase domain-containing protein [Chitinophaga sp. YR627]SFO54263.1 Methyltransferase domain-containing protein [Chitinophaga sp. YR627]
MSKPISFNGSIPRHYQDILTPLLFDHFSVDLAQRINYNNVQKILELASGTGSMTQQIVQHMPTGTQLTGTDLQEDMLAIAKERVNSTDVSWEEVDMTAIPYAENSYDLIVCQFGLMLVPDKQKALSEIHRVLKKGGRFVFTVWADIKDNPAWDICGRIIAHHTGQNPMLRDPGPFALSAEHTTTALLKQTGFSVVTATLVQQTGVLENAALAAKGFIQGLPALSAMSQTDPALISQIEDDVAAEFSWTLGDAPFKTTSQAWVFEVVK